MKSCSIATLKNKLSQYLTLVKEGEEVIITNRNEPFAKIVLIQPKLKSKSSKARENFLKLLKPIELKRGSTSMSEEIRKLRDEE
jgi:prevent-host-death family protein